LGDDNCPEKWEELEITRGRGKTPVTVEVRPEMVGRLSLARAKKKEHPHDAREKPMA